MVSPVETTSELVEKTRGALELLPADQVAELRERYVEWDRINNPAPNPVYEPIVRTAARIFSRAARLAASGHNLYEPGYIPDTEALNRLMGDHVVIRAEAEVLGTFVALLAPELLPPTTSGQAVDATNGVEPKAAGAAIAWAFGNLTLPSGVVPATTPKGPAAMALLEKITGGYFDLTRSAQQQIPVPDTLPDI